MGCALSYRPSPSMHSPPSSLHTMKLQYGYVEARRSTGTGETKSATNGEGERNNHFTEVVDGWPKWLTDNIPTEVLKDIVPKSSDSYIKIDKIGQGTYSNVYKARDRESGMIVALKKVRFDTSEAESVKFMAREIMALQRLDHPNIIKLIGLATSRMQFSIYLVFDYMQSDLSRILSRPDEMLTEPQIKCYMHQLLSGLHHCHERGVLHRDIKASNLLIDKNGMLKIADFGLATVLDPERRRPLTSRVVTLWYRAPELLLGSTYYGIGIDLWSAGCLMAEMFAGRPILPGRTEIEQLHMIFKLCGTPSDGFYKNTKLSTSLKPSQTYKASLSEKCRNFPSSSVGLLSLLLALDPSLRGSASFALDNEFFYTSPLACDLTGLPVIQVEDEDEVPITERRNNFKRNGRHRGNRVRRRTRSETEKRKTKVESEKAKLAEVEETSPLMIIPRPSHDNAIVSRTEAHPSAAKNIINLPPLSTAKIRMNDYDIDLDLPRRSASSTEFRNLKISNLLHLHSLAD